MNDAKQTAEQAPDEIERIFALLEKGLGRELVTDANVDGLIERAHTAGRTILETELREWKAPC